LSGWWLSQGPMSKEVATLFLNCRNVCSMRKWMNRNIQPHFEVLWSAFGSWLLWDVSLLLQNKFSSVFSNWAISRRMNKPYLK
jgi:hypothetical protein